jgi:hypothetical protein
MMNASADDINAHTYPVPRSQLVHFRALAFLFDVDCRTFVGGLGSQHASMFGMVLGDTMIRVMLYLGADCTQIATEQIGTRLCWQLLFAFGEV